MTSIESLNDWFDQNAKSAISIWCEDPEVNKEKVGGFVEKSFLTYRILMKQIGRDLVGVRHRYSEFEAVRTTLWDRYAPLGILVPALPPKKPMSSLINQRTDAVFVKERTHGLTLFCESVVAVPFLRGDHDWKDFMKSPTAPSSNTGENTGESMLIASFSYLEVPFKNSITQRMGEIREEISHVEKFCKHVLDKVRSVQSAERALQSASEALNQGLQAWADVEGSVIKLINGRAFDSDKTIIDEKESVSSSLNTTTALLTGKHACFDDLPDYESVLVVTTLEQELMRLEALKDLFKLHDEIVHSIDVQTAKLAKAETGKAGKAALEAVPEMKLMLDEKQACLAAFYKGLVYFTLPMVARWRAQAFRRSSSYLGSAVLAASCSLQKSSLKFFDDLHMDMHAAAQSSTSVLELLSLKPLAGLPNDLPVSSSETLPAPVPISHGLFVAALESHRSGAGVSSLSPSLGSGTVGPNSHHHANPLASPSNHGNNNNNSSNNNNNSSSTSNSKSFFSKSLWSKGSKNEATNNNNNNNNNSTSETAEEIPPPPASPTPSSPTPSSPPTTSTSTTSTSTTSSSSETPINAPPPVPVAPPASEPPAAPAATSPRPFQATEKSRAILQDLMGSKEDNRSVWE